MIIGIIIGILVWQAVCCLMLTFCVDDNIYDFTSAGIFTVIIWTVGKVKNFIYRKFFYKWAACFVDKDGNTYWIKSYKACEIESCLGSNLKWNESLREKYTIADGWDKKKCLAGIPNLRYVPIKIAKKESIYELTPERIEQFKKSPVHLKVVNKS